MGTSTARELTCDRPASYPGGGVMYSHPLALQKPGISTGLMSLKAREGFNFNMNSCSRQSLLWHSEVSGIWSVTFRENGRDLTLSYDNF